jgi:hypothetical protein
VRNLIVQIACRFLYLYVPRTAPDLHAECCAEPSFEPKIARRFLYLYVPRAPPPHDLHNECCAEPLSSFPAVLKSQFLSSVGSSSRDSPCSGRKGRRLFSMINPLRMDRRPLARQRPISRTPQPPPHNLISEPQPKRKVLESPGPEIAAQRSRIEEKPRIYLNNIKKPCVGIQASQKKCVQRRCMSPVCPDIGERMLYVMYIVEKKKSRTPASSNNLKNHSH